jgi:hypothetical protein
VGAQRYWYERMTPDERREFNRRYRPYDAAYHHRRYMLRTRDRRAIVAACVGEVTSYRDRKRGVQWVWCCRICGDSQADIAHRFDACGLLVLHRAERHSLTTGGL